MKKDTIARSAQEALAHVESVYDCCLLLQDVMDNLETLEEEHSLEDCKVLRRSQALLEFIASVLDNSTNELRWQLSEALEPGIIPKGISAPQFSLFQTVCLKNMGRTREIELCGMSWNTDPTAGKLGWWYSYGDGSGSFHESSLDPIKPAQDSSTNTTSCSKE